MEQCAPAVVFVPIRWRADCRIALAIKLVDPSIQVIGVAPEWENDAWQSFNRGKLVALPAASKSIADAIRVQALGDLPYTILRRYVDEIVTVSEKQIAAATITTLTEIHLVLEPSGAIALAAAQSYQGSFDSSKPVVVIASGGNTTLEFLCSLTAIQ